MAEMNMIGHPGRTELLIEQNLYLVCADLDHVKGAIGKASLTSSSKVDR